MGFDIINAPSLTGKGFIVTVPAFDPGVGDKDFTFRCIIVDSPIDRGDGGLLARGIFVPSQDGVEENVMILHDTSMYVIVHECLHATFTMFRSCVSGASFQMLLDDVTDTFGEESITHAHGYIVYHVLVGLKDFYKIDRSPESWRPSD